MQFILTFTFVLLGLSTCSFGANINGKNDTIAVMESIKQQLHNLEAEVSKAMPQAKLQWQMEVFQQWYQDTKKCSRDISYVYSDWTPIQRRMDGSEDFDRNWSAYRQGFGDENEEFFIGLNKLNEMTKAPQELLILLGDHEGKVAYAKYDKFAVAGEEEKYALKELGDYSGTAGDSLRYHAGKKFSTFDEDNDNSKRNCAKTSQGGWWYGNCFDSYSFVFGFLNAPHVDPLLKGESSKGMIWDEWHGLSYSLKFSQMMIRPKK